MRLLSYFILIIMLSSCFKGKHVDTIIHNAQIHVMDDKMTIHEAIAIKDGEIVQVGPEREILNGYSADNVINAQQKDVYPGFHDAHGHIMSLAKQMQNVDLTGVRSYIAMITKLEKFQQKTNRKVITGRGWDQSLWSGTNNLPNNEALNKAFPETPVALTRIDGHAMLINQAMIDYAGITDTTFVEGGVVVQNEGKLTGIILDNAIDIINDQIPQPSEKELKSAILKIQNDLFALGITHVHEAGLKHHELKLFDEMATSNELKLNTYAMLFPTEKNISFAERNGHYKNKSLSVRSFKLLLDGSLGSHGACMLAPYSDSSTHGILLESISEIKRILNTAKSLNYQVNSHCIGDSANRIMLHAIDTLLKDSPDHRWRIEHAQVVHPDDFKYFGTTGAIPSVQPTHATTDYRWAEDHIGEDRLEGAYAYRSLQKENGMILFGTDFPVESYNPFATIHAAVYRRNTDNEPIDGFLIDEAVDLTTTLKAMTLWPAFGCFEESNVGTLEKGKKATLVIFDHQLQAKKEYLPNYAYLTMINGEIVFSMQ